ncbi:TetR/AcrR family transcriptional regulator [Microbacterium sp. NPDC057944]|uniref:TetR/AcrR family transcriptional regulator n=1 Tax=Microbacterium sp. NPDC057944 TaxID=3346286 RepID=UPI0036D7A6A1
MTFIWSHRSSEFGHLTDFIDTRVASEPSARVACEDVGQSTESEGEMPYLEQSVRREQFIGAARSALAKHGVARASVRVVAAEAGVPLATMQYVFPSKEALLRAVIEDVGDEIASVLEASADTHHGLERAIRTGLDGFWSRLVEGGRDLQLVQYELTLYALRTAEHQDLARQQYHRYTAIVAGWCQRAAEASNETIAIPVEDLARAIVAGVDGLILQHLCDPVGARARDQLVTLADMTVRLALSRHKPLGAI